MGVGVKSNPVIVLWVHSFSAPGVEGGNGFLLSIVWIFGVSSLWWLMRRPGQVEGAGHGLSHSTVTVISDRSWSQLRSAGKLPPETGQCRSDSRGSHSDHIVTISMKRDSGILLVSYSALPYPGEPIVRRESQVNSSSRKKMSFRSLFIRLLSSSKRWRGKFKGDRENNSSSNDKRRERSFSVADVRKVVRAEREIERFQRDFVLPLETWRGSSCQELRGGASDMVTDCPDGKRMVDDDDRKSVGASSSCYDSGHFSETSSFLQSSESESPPESLTSVSPSSSTSSSFKRSFKRLSNRFRAKSMGNIQQRSRYDTHLAPFECLQDIF